MDQTAVRRARSAVNPRNLCSAIARIERCVDRLLQNATAQDASEEDLRRYTRDTYCARFERSGWIYEDGAMSIEAYIWLEESGTCVASEGDPPGTCRARPKAPGPWVLDRALLRHIKRSEVRDYLERLQREGAVECDDGTPLDNLGVP